MTRLLTATLGVLLAMSAPALARDHQSARQAAAQEHGHDGHGQPAASGSLAGVWALTMLSHQVGLELEQDGATLSGRMLIMGTYVEVTGEVTGGAFTLTGKASLGAGHPSGRRVPLRLTGHLEADGTIAGEVDTENGPQPWTGERLPTP